MIIKRVTQQRTLMSIFTLSFWLMFFGIFLGGAILSRYSQDSQLVIMPFILCFFVLFFGYGGYNWLIAYSVKSRRKQLALLETEHSFKAGYEPISFASSSLNALNKDVVKRFSHMVRGQDWAYSDFSCSYTGHSKFGDYTERIVYYSVMTMSLPRKLPHMFFDSVKARKRQFRLYFQNSQTQSLEGDFDQHFTAYFPAEYHIDGRSLVSPEVMEALIAADDYDVEVIGDKVFLYGDLRDPHTQIQDMLNKIHVIKEKLLNNAPTYRDEALPYAEGRKSVAPLGAQLAINLTMTYVKLFAAVAVMVLGTILATATKPLSGMSFYMILISGIVAVQNLYIIIREKQRRQAIRTAQKYSKTTAQQKHP